MSKNYDSWERLLTVVLRREWDNYLALCSSSDDPTDSSDGCSSSSQFTGHRPSCSCYECHNTRQGVPDPMLPTSSYSQKYSNASNDRVDYPGSSGAPGKFRLVRCPKCGGILPELTEYSVYECGGCGAFLKAKNKGVDMKAFSEKSDEERIIGVTVENLSNIYDKTMNISERRTVNVDPTTDGYESNVRSNFSSSSGRTSRDRSETKMTSLTSKDEKRAVEANDIIQDKPKTAQGFVDGFNNLEYSGEQDLNKMDELRDQLSRLGSSIEKGKAKAPVDSGTGPPPPEDPCASSKNYLSLEDNSYPYKQFRRPSNQHSIEYADQPPPPYMHRQEIGGNGFYPPQYTPNHVHGYADPPRSNYMHSGDPYHISSSRSYMSSRHYMDNGIAYMDARTFSHHHHHPSCLCYECHKTRQGVPAPTLTTSYSEKFSNVSNDRVAFPYHDYPGSRDNNHKFPNAAPLRSYIAPQSHSRYPHVASSEVSGFARRPPPRARHLASSGGKHYRLISGGAPILSCYNCFEVLLLPQKVLANNNRSRKKMRCGACSTIIAFSVSNKNLISEPEFGVPLEVHVLA